MTYWKVSFKGKVESKDHKPGEMSFLDKFPILPDFLWLSVFWQGLYIVKAVIPYWAVVSSKIWFKFTSWICICWHHTILCTMIICRNILGGMLMLFLQSIDICNIPWWFCLANSKFEAVAILLLSHFSHYLDQKSKSKGRILPYSVMGAESIAIGGPIYTWRFWKMKNQRKNALKNTIIMLIIKISNSNSLTMPKPSSKKDIFKMKSKYIRKERPIPTIDENFQIEVPSCD